RERRGARAAGLLGRGRHAGRALRVARLTASRTSWRMGRRDWIDALAGGGKQADRILASLVEGSCQWAVVLARCCGRRQRGKQRAGPGGQLITAAEQATDRVQKWPLRAVQCREDCRRRGDRGAEATVLDSWLSRR